jgi:hypothetical protein
MVGRFVATSGEKHGRQWGLSMAAVGENPMAIDTDGSQPSSRRTKGSSDKLKPGLRRISTPGSMTGERK